MASVLNCKDLCEDSKRILMTQVYLGANCQKVMERCIENFLRDS